MRGRPYYSIQLHWLQGLKHQLNQCVIRYERTKATA